MVKMGAARPRIVANHTTNETAPPIELCPSDVECFLDGVDTWFAEHVFLGRLIGTAITLLLGYAIVKLGDRALTKSARRIARLRRADDYQTKVIVGRTKPMRLTIRLAVLVVVAIALLAVWGLQTAFTGLLAGAGFAGIVIGLAAADTIGDVIAGFLIFYNHPFDLGDWVVIDGVEGIVEDVALGATTILTFDNEKVTIPNRVVEGNQIKNYSHGRKLRRRLVVGVEYGSHLGQAMETLVELANDHPDIMKDPAPTAVSKGFGASSVDLELRFYVEPVRSSVIKTYTDMVHAVHDTFRQRGIGIAFPHTQIVQGRPWQLAGHDGGAKETPSSRSRDELPGGD